MEALVDAGLTRAIGLSNFNSQLILDLLRYARVRPSTLQIEHHPYLVQPTLVEFAQFEGIRVTAYSSFGPTGYVEMDLKHAVAASPLYKHPIILDIASKHAKSPFQVLLRWATQQEVAVIPKSDTADMMAENLAANTFDLTDSEIKEISNLDRDLRFNDPYMVRCSFLSSRETPLIFIQVFWLLANLRLAEIIPFCCPFPHRWAFSQHICSNETIVCNFFKQLVMNTL